MKRPTRRFTRFCAVLAVGGAAGCSGSGSGPSPNPAADLIVFQSGRNDPTSVIPKQEIYAMNGDGTGQTRLTNNLLDDQEPVLSPDRRQIAFRENTGASLDTAEIMVMNADGTNVRRLTNDAFQDDRPTWSPDGQRIVFRSRRASVSDLFVINTDGTGQTQLTTGGGSELAPSFTRSNQVLFVQDQAGVQRICRINADGTGFTALTDGPSDGSPNASPDGTKIVYTSRDAGANSEIFVMNADGTGQTRLTTSTDIHIKPVWSPDGRRIVFAASVLIGGRNNTDIYVMNANGTGRVRLTTNPSLDSLPDVR